MIPRFTIRAAPRTKTQQLNRIGRFRNQAERDAWHETSPLRGPVGFELWLRRYCYVIDADTVQEIPFQPYPGQQRLIRALVAQYWLLILKGRQLGFTSIMAAYATWRLCYSWVFRSMIVNQELDYAKDFIGRIEWIMERLPAWNQLEYTTKNKQRLEFNAGGATRVIRSVAGGRKAGRSVTGDLVVFDEAGYIEEFQETLSAAAPGIESAKGQIVVLSTSAGPAGGFYELWEASTGPGNTFLDEYGVGPTRFRPFFIRWDERPGRDAKWYEEQKPLLASLGPTAMQREYPNTPEEAFEHAAGRIYPLFTAATHVGRISLTQTGYERYRAVDWGETKSAYVVLWIAHFPGGPPGLIIDPSCPNTINELRAYRWDEDRPGKPLKENDHAPDALRYAVVTFDLRGTVYVYREVYRTDSLAKGWNPMKEIREIHEASGWEQVPAGEGKRYWRPTVRGEDFVHTVADRALGKMIALFNEFDIPCTGQKRIRSRAHQEQVRPLDKFDDEVIEGIRLVSILVDGSEAVHKAMHVDRETQAITVADEHLRERRRVKAATPLHKRRILELAKAMRRRRP